MAENQERAAKQARKPYVRAGKTLAGRVLANPRFVVALVVALAVPASASAATGPMKIHYYQRPGSACASTNPTAAGVKKYTSSDSQTGLAFDGSELLVSCWGDGSILKVSEAGSDAQLDRLHGSPCICRAFL